jgi:two-component system, sensor histidine kinase PdtaS
MSGVRLTFFIICLFLASLGTNYANSRYAAADDRSAAITSVHNLWAQGERILNKQPTIAADWDSALHIARNIAAISRKFQYDAGLGFSKQLMSASLRHSGRGMEAIAYARQAVSILSKVGTEKQKADAYIELGGCYSNAEADLPEKIIQYENGARIYQQLGDAIQEAALLEMIGDLYHLKKDYPTALSKLQQSLFIYQAAGFKRLQGVYALIGTVYNEQQNFVEGLRYNMLAVKTGETVKDSTKLMATVYHRLAMGYYSINYYKQAMEYYNKALHLAYQHNDSLAIQNYQINIAELLTRTQHYQQGLDSLNAAANFYPITDINDIGYLTIQYMRLYIGMRDFRKAAQYYQKILQIYDGGKISDYQRALLSSYIALYLVEAGRFREASHYLDRISTNEMPYRLTTFTLERLRFKTDSALGNLTSAIQHFQRYKILSDSMTSLAQARQLGQLQLQFETEQKDKDIRLLTQKSQLQATSLEKERMIRYVIIGGILVLIGFLILVYNRYQHNKHTSVKLESQQEEINTQNEALRGLLDEKEWLLKEIHHRVKNNLQIIISLLNTQSQYLNNKDALAAIRNSQQRMYSMSLIHQRLYQADDLGKIDMHWYIPEMIGYIKDCLEANEHISFHLECDDIKLDVVEAVPLGLILNEAVSNALKYAFPDGRKGRINIWLKTNPENCCILTVSDNGTGIPAGKDLQETASLGMSLMQGLSEQLDGTFVLTDNHPGVCVTVTFMCKEFISTEKIHTLN